MTRIILVLLFLIFSAPVYFLFTGSLLRASKILAMPPQLWPTNPVVDNYLWAMSLPDLSQWAFNTVLVTGSVSILTTIITVLCGYAFSTYSFKFKKQLWPILLVGMMVPYIAIVIPLFIVSSNIGIYGTVWAVILPSLYYPLGIFLSKTFFDTIPRSLIEAARIDGAHEFTILARVSAPLSAPIITCIALFSAIGALQNWIWQNLQLTDSKSATMLVGLLRETMVRSVSSNDTNPIGHSMAGAIILLFPLIVIFAIANKYFLLDLKGAVDK